MIPTHLSELILMTGGGSYTLDAACNSDSSSGAQQQLNQSLPFEHVIVDEVELNLPVHLYTSSKDQSTVNAAELMVMMPSSFLGSNTSNISNLKIIFKICQD